MAYNEEHGITPTSARRQITDKIDTGEAEAPNDNQAIAVTHAFPDVDISILRSPDLLAKEIARLEKELKALSRDLKFEEAAKVRDKVVGLREFVLQWWWTMDVKWGFTLRKATAFLGASLSCHPTFYTKHPHFLH